MRRKEGLADYRYFPEPDLPDLEVGEAMMAAARGSMAELPVEKRTRWGWGWGLGLGLGLGGKGWEVGVAVGGWGRGLGLIGEGGRWCV